MSGLHRHDVIALLLVLGTIAAVSSKGTGRKLFLSRRIVTDSLEFDGGVLVDDKGVISGLYSKKSVKELLQKDDGSLQIIDGGDWALMAGVVDSHVHINDPGRTDWEGVATATRAAAAGGITTVIDMPLNSIPPTTTVENLKVKVATAKEQAFVDIGFWGGIIPGNEAELLNMIKAGVVGFKGYLINSGIKEFPNLSADELDQVFTTVNGTDTVLLFHSELPVASENKECDKCGCPDPMLYNTYLESHPAEMEYKAARLLSTFIPKYDVRVHVVHVSAAAVIPILDRARNERIKVGSTRYRGGVTAETCHHYLFFSSEQIPPGRTEFKCSPPIRDRSNKERLWEYIRDRRIDLVASDHSPSVAALKEPNFMTAWGGVASVQFGLSLFWTQAKARGHSLSTVSHFLSSGPARLAGLQNKKGAIRPGLDADLIFFDPTASFVVTPDIILHKNKITPYMQSVLTGKVMQTYLRGQLIYTDGEVSEKPHGQLLINAAELAKL